MESNVHMHINLETVLLHLQLVLVLLYVRTGMEWNLVPVMIPSMIALGFSISSLVRDLKKLWASL